jgi:hypothetical protein
VSAQAGSCSVSPVVCENQLAGNPSSEWDISGAGDPAIQGFATDISVNRGQTISFKIDTDATNYRLAIYRIGYYGGLGARKITTILPSASLPQAQPACLTDASTGLADCGNWSVSASWTVPADAISGVYLVNVNRVDTGGASHILFVVRDDTRQADVLVQTSDTTWQAYNQYGGASLYCGGPVSNAGTDYTCGTRATKVSYNRPLATRGPTPEDAFFSAEYPMVRWLEANGYDVKYWAGVDTDRRSTDLTGPLKPKVFLSVGHDEYWSGDQRTGIENARSSGVNLAFFSGNEMYWKTRYEPSIDGSNTAFRTLVTYKETLSGVKIDPAVDAAGHPIWTGTWRDPRFSPPGDGGRPENGVSGTIGMVDSGTTAITVPAAMAGLRFWRNTSVAALTSGVATLTANSLGYEWDEDLDNGLRPAGLVDLSSTTVNNVQLLLNFGAAVSSGMATHSLTLYRHPSGALVFGAGTVQWTWGLDSTHDRDFTPPDPAMQQATVNLLADMKAQPLTLQAGLIPAAASTDTVPPTSTIASPLPSASFLADTLVTISGTAIDTGGHVAGVEVSVDGGLSWGRALGLASWTFPWRPSAPGAVTIKTRATDDSGNIETPGVGTTVIINANGRVTCPCNIWPANPVPTNPDWTDLTASDELGVKFQSDVSGFITGVRFYKGVTNTGTHVGNLWTSAGALLATATFTSESASGWQEVDFATPVAVTANTVYVASYHTNAGHYAAEPLYFASAGVDIPPLHALSNAVAGGNGVFIYIAATAFPTMTFSATNYWVDVVFNTPTIAWSAPAPIIYPAPLTPTQLNATAAMPGTFVYTPAMGTIPLPGAAQMLSVTFTPTDTTRTASTASVAIMVLQGTPTITWPTPADILYGTALGAAQLNATASVPGTFVYMAAAGTVLPAGLQTLSVTFTPANTSYATVKASATIMVTAAPSLTLQPVKQIVTAGQGAQFTVAASGDPTLTYQWQLSANGGLTWSALTDSPPYSGVTMATLTVSHAPPTLRGDMFRAVVTNGSGSATSNPAVLTVRTVVANFDGRTQSDIAVFRPSNGTWYVRLSSVGDIPASAAAFQWGLAGDIPIAGDFDGDGQTDLTVFRPSTGTWFIRYSSSGYGIPNAGAFQWGLPGDIPVSGDFDGDGITDLAVFRPSTGTWYIR